ncbi:UNVERIFIED_CONTAM: Short-chain dehydrogenase reductase 2a [Sesamum radiatum]|uniref:Short-chain dehydrogenase reductase 2a n=1 Tax=Sesamum radiatum TaxID=300843 RepID=A0AAW2NN20_SESRA
MPAQFIPEITFPGSQLPPKEITSSIISIKRLEGKVAIVTGGARGIGEATVRLFAIHGAKEHIQALINSTLSNYGKLDILFNNAGVLGNQSKHKSILDFDADEFDQVMRVNVRGTALGMKHAARAMIGARTAGCIISTASVAGVMGGLGPHSYTASKHAIVGLTKNAACELGRYGIRVNCISPFGGGNEDAGERVAGRWGGGRRGC